MEGKEALSIINIFNEYLIHETYKMALWRWAELGLPVRPSRPGQSLVGEADL